MDLKSHRREPGGFLPESYFKTRYETLRKPLGFPMSAAYLPDDDESLHAWVEYEGIVGSVGRAHLIPDDSGGGGADTADEGAADCPDFTPLLATGEIDAYGNPLPNPESLRPAIQIRQMGTLDDMRRRGMGSLVLSELEEGAVEVWGAKAGFLQARLPAISFYESTGWIRFGDEYDVPGIGLHISMWKRLGE